MRPTKGPQGPRRMRPAEEPIVVEEGLNDGQTVPKNQENCTQKTPFSEAENESDVCNFSHTYSENCVGDREEDALLNDGQKEENGEGGPKNVRISTRADEFLKWYRESFGMRKRAQRAFIASKLAPYFSGRKELNAYVDKKMQDRMRAEAIRRIRCQRRASLHELSYFCTFTYDSGKLTEKEFEKRLLTALPNFASRKKWKYMGAWGRGGDTDRLHFHAIMHIPKDGMAGKLEQRREYDVQKSAWRSARKTRFSKTASEGTPFR